MPREDPQTYPFPQAGRALRCCSHFWERQDRHILLGKHCPGIPIHFHFHSNTQCSSIHSTSMVLRSYASWPKGGDFQVSLQPLEPRLGSLVDTPPACKLA